MDLSVNVLCELLPALYDVVQVLRELRYNKLLLMRDPLNELLKLILYLDRLRDLLNPLLDLRGLHVESLQLLEDHLLSAPVN